MARQLTSGIAVLLAAAAAAAQDRPTAMRLFPARTVLFVRTADATGFSERFWRGSGGRMARDPEIAPFVDGLYRRVDDAFASGPGEATGGGLSKLLELFQGEAALGLAPLRGQPPVAVLALADTVSAADRAAGDAVALADGRERAQRLIETLRAYAEANGNAVATERLLTADVTVIRPNADSRDAFAFLERDGVLVFCSDRLVMESVVAKWDAATGPPDRVEAGPPATETADSTDTDADAKRVARLRKAYEPALADKPGFSESLRQCVEERLGGGDEGPPQAVAYLDPLGVFRGVAQNNAGARVALATLPVLGLDGVRGAAAALWLDEGDWDAVFRAHLLLDNPRAGLLKIARLEPADTTPSDAVPAGAMRYGCGAFAPGAILGGVGELYDRIRGEGEFDKLLRERIADKVGMPVDDLVALFTGRFESVQGYGETPDGESPRVMPARALLLSTADPDEASQALREVIARLDSEAVWTEYGGVAVAAKRRPVDEEGRPTRGRQADWPCVAVIGDAVALCQTQALLEQLIDAQNGEAPRLKDHLPFRLTASRARRLGYSTTGGVEGQMLTYEDPTPFYRRAVEAAGSTESRQALDAIAERAPPMRWLRDTLDEAGAPSAEALLRYTTPTGGALYDTPTGFRYVAFAFRPADPE